MDTILEEEKPRVFITNFAGHDYSAANRYGELVYITKGYVSFQSLDRIKFHVAEVVKDTRPQDFLLLSGTPLLSILASLLWFHIHKQVKLLSWDKKTNNSYRVMVITESNLIAMLDVLNNG